MGEMTYRESLAVTWLLLWRGAAIGAGIGFVIGFILGFAGAALGYGDLQGIQLLIILIVGGISIFVVYPLVVRMALRKQFDGFHLQVTRP
jgi:Mg/Co/Ni transporter MgtE